MLNEQISALDFPTSTDPDHLTHFEPEIVAFKQNIAMEIFKD